MERRRIKIIVALLGCILAINSVYAQNGKYKVTNQNELATSMLEQSLRSSLPTIYSEEPEREHAGMAPAEIDTSELMDEMSNVLAQWIMLQVSNEEQRAIASAIPALVTIDETKITIFNDKDSTMNVYEVLEVKNTDTQWVFQCKDNKQVRLSTQSDGIYILSVPDMKPIKLRKNE